MQLKTVGESLTALNSINGLINRLNNNTITYNQVLCGLAGVGDAYSLSTLKMAISQTKLNEEQIRAILVSNGLQGELLETTTAELTQITTNNAMTVSENAATTATARFSYAVKGLGASFKAFLVAHPVLTAIAAIGVTVYTVTKIIDACTTSFDELKEEISELKQEISDSESEIEDISSQLKDVNQKIKDIQSLGTPTFTEEGELKNLQKQKTELENLYNIEKARHELAQKKLEDTAQEYLSKTSESKYKTVSYTQKKVQNGQFVDVSYTKAAYTTQLEEMKAAASEMRKQQKIIDQLNSDYNNLDETSNKEDKEYKKNLEEAENARDKAKETALNIQKEAQEQVEGLDESSKSYQQVFEASQYLSDQIAFMNNDIKSLSSEGKKSYFKQNVSFDDKETKQEFNKFVDELSDEELELLLDVSIDEDSTIDEIKGNLGKVVDIVQEEIARNSESISFTNIFSLKTESGEATALSNLKDNINEITTAYQALSEATEEYRTTGSLSFSTIEKLMESGDEWLNYLTVENGQLRINEQAYYDMAQAKLYELKVQALQNLSEQVKGLQNTRDAMKWVETQNYDTADSYKTLASEVMNETITELNAKKALAKTDAEKSYWQDTIDMYQQRAEQIDKMFDSVDMHGMLSGGESVLSDTLAQAQKIADLINTVKEEIEDNGKVSVSTLQDIASAYPVLEKYVQDYMAGVEGSKANLIAQLNQMYEQDVNNYKSAWLLKAQYDRSFWVDFQNGSADVVNRLRDQYGVDLKNFESYEQARCAITQKILEAQAKIVQADLYVMRKTTGDITRSAEVAGLTTDQKRNAQDMWTNWKDEYLNAKLNNQEYLITADQMAQNLEHAGGLNPSSAKDLAKTLYTNLMALGVDSGRGYIDGLRAELDGLDTSFETYSADYADKVSLAFDDPVKLDSSKSDKDTKETFDWIEIKIQRLTELLDKLKTKADNTYASWSSRNTALAQAIDKTYEAINLQSQAYNRYMQEADSVGLSGYYKTLVQNGAIDISTISDKNLKDQINEYQTW